MFVARKGATLLFESGPANNPYQHHLFVILTEPYGPAQQVVMVPICTIKHDRHDLTCVVEVGEHEFIKAQSFVSYSEGRVEAASVLQKGVAKGFFVPKEQANQRLFDKIFAGVRKSNRSRPFLKTAIADAAKEK